MFLKRIIIQGFKSFADKIVIDFEDNITGVVGPNGCGKSNIVDAIRWVLGEQSAKSLRGEKMTDVIFAGSEKRKAQNIAEVTLVFNNEQHFLNNENTEVEITRRLDGIEQEGSFFINRKPVRMKDVVELILDSGLGKDSLSIITQGNISSFAEAKPYERRGVFEEAAGVSKYKKRKMESLAHLERTKNNLERTQDILNELEKQVTPLRRQAKKAELYNSKKSRLQEIEIAVLVDKITKYQTAKDTLNKQIADLENQINMAEGYIAIQDQQNLTSKQELRQCDKAINDLQEKHFKLVNEIQLLEKRHAEMTEKHKYALETGDIEAKLASLTKLLKEAEFEYQDRNERLNKLQNDLSLNNTALDDTLYQISDLKFKKDSTDANIRRIENRLDYLNNLIADPFAARSQSGIKAIMDNQKAFMGVLGVVGQVLKPHEGYAIAISTALQGALYNIITDNEASARNAINFLHKNQSGRATFLPLTVLKEHSIAPQHRMLAEKHKGYLGIACDFVDSDPIYDTIITSLLGNVIIMDDLENANEVAKMINYGYKIVTLKGDIIHRGGSMTGGSIKNDVTIMTAEHERDLLQNDLISLKAQKTINDKDLAKCNAQKESIEKTLYDTNIAIAQLEPLIEVKKAKYDKYRLEYEDLKANNVVGHIDEGDYVDVIAQELSDKYAQRDALSNELKSQRDARNKLNNDIEYKEQQIKKIREQSQDANHQSRKLSADLAADNANMENDINRLASEYHMTYDYAKANSTLTIDDEIIDEVANLRNDLANLGNINMNAPEEYQKVSERYEFMKKNYEDLLSSRDKILNVIDDMDKVMTEQFLETFNAINGELNNTFRSLFGGGKAKLVLEDPEDILNTGIDIDIQPPGKAVKSIRLFSGGEKTLIAICVLFTILKVKNVPLVVFDEVEAALDQANVEKFAKYIRSFGQDTQFIVITHRPGTMTQCDTLYGVTMQHRGVSQILKVRLVDAIEMAERKDDELS